MRFDATGKVSLDHIYTEPDPRAYFGALRELDYRIPELAKPYFGTLIQEYRKSREVDVPTVLDIGCSYGVNGVLLRCDATMDDLYDRYRGDASALDQDRLLARDQEFVRARDSRNARFVGLDSSLPALSYGLSAGFIDDAVHADLEQRDPTAEQREQLAGTDIVISTGCIGYVTEQTIARVARAPGEHKPWMAHFVLRMFSFDPVADSLADLGYETVPVDRLFPQRRFVSAEEQSLVLDTLSAGGVDPRGLEDDGWFYARLHLSRPRDTGGCALVDLAAMMDIAASKSPNQPIRG
ncbi:class I SAM-dependent methyltransferase [Actinokineospora sp.]|uniref:class I SAM-dependent methyltransferase n=1 Tax=Actinokineospora sp. TaxID=1872133 RepID=UPI004037AF10